VILIILCAVARDTVQHAARTSFATIRGLILALPMKWSHNDRLRRSPSLNATGRGVTRYAEAAPLSCFQLDHIMSCSPPTCGYTLEHTRLQDSSCPYWQFSAITNMAASALQTAVCRTQTAPTTAVQTHQHEKVQKQCCSTIGVHAARFRNAPIGPDM
jgi:hypothetical protein